MFKFEHTIETVVSAKALWALYSDVSTWKRWDAGIEAVTLNGPFAEGTSGTLTPRGQNPLIFKLVEVREGERFTNETEMPEAGVILHFIHTLQPINGKTRISHQVMITGLAADVLGPQMGPVLTRGIPETMQSLVATAGLG